jgi:hypothetical protein
MWMKGFITKALAVVCLAGGLAGGGCACYRDIVDPCYPQRYEYEARRSVDTAFAAQVSNGHILDQTVWDWEFDPGTDKLTVAGQEHLARLARARPHPDTHLFLQTAQTVAYDPVAPEKFANTRSDLDNKRVQAIQKYTMTETSGRPLVFDVTVHDPNDPSIMAARIAPSIPRMYEGARGILPIGGVSVTGGAGAISGAGR